jgi:prevent-host-death family protein
MKTLGLFEAKNKFSEVCDSVARTGEPVVVTRRGHALVRIMPVVDKPHGSAVWTAFRESRAKYGEPTEEFKVPERTSTHRPDPLSDLDAV